MKISNFFFNNFKIFNWGKIKTPIGPIAFIIWWIIRFIEKITKRYGLTPGELDLEYRRRVELLYQLYKKRIFSYDEVQKITNNYYKKPKEVLKQFGIK